MPRPDFLTDQDITRFQEIIQEDPLAKQFVDVPLFMEVCYAGVWLAEELEKLNCPEDLSVRIQFHAGTLCFGRDPWDVHQEILEGYRNDTLEYGAEPSTLN